MTKSIVIIEDEVHIGENYRDALQRHGFQVALYNNKSSAMAAIANRLPDLVLIDIGLGDDADAGFDICRELRAQSSILPIIFLTARDGVIDEVSGFRLGANDYLSKDIKIDQVLARVAALFRYVDAHRESANADPDIRHGDLLIDEDRMLVHWKGQTVDVSVTEFWILQLLAKRPGHVKSKDQIMDAANIVCEPNTIASHIRRIRNKFKEIDAAFDQIETLQSAGYRWRSV